jgi:hypothetical protein
MTEEELNDEDELEEVYEEDEKTEEPDQEDIEVMLDPSDAEEYQD